MPPATILELQTKPGPDVEFMRGRSEQTRKNSRAIRLYRTESVHCPSLSAWGVPLKFQFLTPPDSGLVTVAVLDVSTVEEANLPEFSP